MNSLQDAWSFLGQETPGQDWDAAFRPLMFFTRIMGLFPLSLRGPDGGRKYSANNASLIYSAVVCILSITFFVMLQSSESLAAFQRTEIAQMVMQLLMLIYVLLTIVIFMTAIFAEKKLANIINNMYAQDVALGKFGIRFDYAADFKHSCIRLGMILLLIAVLHICDFFSVSKLNSRYPLNWLMWMYIRCIRIMSGCLFAEMNLALKRKFDAINNILKKIIMQTKDSPVEIIYMRFKICERIRFIARIHGDLSESASTLNQIFGVQIAVRIIFAVISLTSGSYYTITMMLNSNGNFNQLSGFLAWGLLNVLDILYIIWTCVAVQKQANLTGKLIHKLNVHEFDSAMNITIQLFSLQLEHTKIKFTGAGLFAFDATLIRSVVGAMTAYLVIVLQFDATKP